MFNDYGSMIAIVGVGNLLTMAVIGVSIVRSLTRMEMKVDTMWKTFESQLERRADGKK
jgi:hypothetical protein